VEVAAGCRSHKRMPLPQQNAALSEKTGGEIRSGSMVFGSREGFEMRSL